ncbi:MAG: hypothetical protein HUU06_13985, partial [Planctomycetaceae bacterium]|nr:hypothetical protein [Planctomycetaceae bacterium]
MAPPAGGGPPIREGAWTASVLLVLASFLFACLTLGAVEPWAQSVLGAGAAAALLLALAAGRLHPLPGGEEARVGLLVPEMFVLGILALGVLQVLPLPPELHRTLSPAAARVFDDGLPPEDGGRWRTLSVYPWATRVEVLRLAALGAVFSLFARGLRRTSEARFALGGFVALGTLAAVLGVVDSSLEGGLLGWYPREGTFRDRVAGVLVNPNHFAGLLEMTLLAALGLLFAAGAREEGGEGRERGGRFRPPWAPGDGGRGLALLLA